MYTALYRQWRPGTFKDVVGQDTIVRTLNNQIASGHIAHAYLFCGSRGTGKTSTAKIFARAINCQSPDEYGPCGKCEVCINLSSDSNMDVVEIDAASNNGVDEIRDLRDKVHFPPAVGRYKVYIIDEVHMLSIGAFNALLKTLEEPPAHVVFILATTEPHKLPATILSRCQRFDFKRIPSGVLVKRMKTICDNMNVTVEEEALHTIARWAEGGMRDALSLLDQCMSFCGSDITNNDVLDILGTEDQSFVFDAVDDILNGNLQSLLHKIGRLIDNGKELNVFLRDLLNHMRNLLIVKSCTNPEGLLDVAESTMEQLKAQAKTAGEARLIRSIELLSPLESEMRYSSQPRILMELAAVKLCRPQQEASLEALMDRIECLEKGIKNGVAVACEAPPLPDLPHEERKASIDVPSTTASSEAQNDSAVFEPVPRAVPKAANNKPKADNQGEPKTEQKAEPGQTQQGSNSVNDPVSGWTSVLELISRERQSLNAALIGVRPQMEENGVMTLVFPPASGFHIMLIEQESNRRFIEEAVQKVTGQQVKIKCMMQDQMDKKSSAVDDDYIVKKAIEVFGKDLVEVVEE